MARVAVLSLFSGVLTVVVNAITHPNLSAVSGFLSDLNEDIKPLLVPAQIGAVALAAINPAAGALAETALQDAAAVGTASGGIATALNSAIGAVGSTGSVVGDGGSSGGASDGLSADLTGLSQDKQQQDQQT